MLLRGRDIVEVGLGESNTMAQGVKRGRWVREIVEAKLTELTIEDAGG